MIERITIENFKSLKMADLKLGRLNLFIGTNASGKSNLLDAIRMLGGIAAGRPPKEVFDGAPSTSARDAWRGIRGGWANAFYQAPELNHKTRPSQAHLGIRVVLEPDRIDYQIAFDGLGVTTGERLSSGGEEIFAFDGRAAHFGVPEGKTLSCPTDAYAGSQVHYAYIHGRAGIHNQVVEGWKKQLRTIQFLEFDPDTLRHYGTPSEIEQMGERGENFASVIRHICSSGKQKKAYLTWLRELRPQEVDDVTTLSGAVGEPMFALKEGGREFPAPALSDGTLRFAALTAAFFQPAMPRVLAVEEIENGIHGSRLRLLVELLRSQAATTKTQVLATTHSPLVLAWLQPQEYATTFLCRRDEITGESRICPLTEIPHFNEIIQKQTLSELFAEGWMETAV